MIEISHFRSFVVLSQTLHFGKAAEQLRITQPSLSQQIKKLEDELKVILFERNPHFVKLTRVGNQFLPHALKVLEAHDQALQVLSHDKNPLEGVVRLAFIPTIGPYVLPKLVKILRQKAPHIKLELYELTTTLLIEQLKQGAFDLGVVALPIQDSGLVSASLGKEDFVLAVSKTHPLALKRHVKLNDLSREDVLMLKEGHCFREQALEFCANHNSNLKVTFEGSSLVSVMNLVSANLGVTLVPQMATHKASNDLQFVKFASPQPHREIGLVWRMSYGLKAREKFLLEVMKGCV